MFDYPVTLTPDDDTILVTFPDIPEAITFGKDDFTSHRCSRIRIVILCG